jgi:limonene-1,2-epoxide hydrolase
MNKVEFKDLLQILSDAWQRKDYAKAVEVFAEDIRYADPLRYRLSGKAELRAFFEADEGYAQLTVWRVIGFDEEQQIGFAEYTFEGTHRYHGAVIIKVEDDKITHWREYQHIDPRDWQEFAGDTAF